MEGELFATVEFMVLGSRPSSAGRVRPARHRSKVAPSPFSNDDANATWPWPWEARPQDVVTPLSFAANALYDFTPGSANELALRKGELVYVIGRSSHGWLVAHRGAGNEAKKGLVPASYISALKALQRPTAAALASSIEALHSDLQQWRPQVPIDGANARLLSDRLRKLAEWVSPEEAHQPQSPHPDSTAAGTHLALAAPTASADEDDDAGAAPLAELTLVGGNVVDDEPKVDGPTSKEVAIALRSNEAAIAAAEEEAAEEEAAEVEAAAAIPASEAIEAIEVVESVQVVEEAVQPVEMVEAALTVIDDVIGDDAPSALPANVTEPRNLPPSAPPSATSAPPPSAAVTPPPPATSQWVVVFGGDSTHRAHLAAAVAARTGGSVVDLAGAFEFARDAPTPAAESVRVMHANGGLIDTRVLVPLVKEYAATLQPPLVCEGLPRMPAQVRPSASILDLCLLLLAPRCSCPRPSMYIRRPYGSCLLLQRVSVDHACIAQLPAHPRSASRLAWSSARTIRGGTRRMPAWSPSSRGALSRRCYPRPRMLHTGSNPSFSPCYLLEPKLFHHAPSSSPSHSTTVSERRPPHRLSISQVSISAYLVRIGDGAQARGRTIAHGERDACRYHGD